MVTSDDLYNILFQRLAFLLVHSALSVYSATTRFTETVDSIILIENQLKQNDSIYSLNDQITTQENGPIGFSGISDIHSKQFPGWILLFFFNFSHVPLSIDQNSTKINKKRAKSESTTTSVRSRDGKVRRSLFGPWSVNVLSTRSSEVKIIMSAFMARRFCQNDNFRSLPVSLSQSKTISKVRTK